MQEGRIEYSLQRAAMDYMCGLTTLEAQFVSVERVAQRAAARKEAPRCYDALGTAASRPRAARPARLPAKRWAREIFFPSILAHYPEGKT